MKILLIGPVPSEIGSNNPGGIARHVWSLANKLSQKGHDVSIMGIGRYYKRNCNVKGITIYGIDNLFRGLLRGLFFVPRLLSEIGRIPRYKDYVHAFYSFFRIDSINDLNRYDIIHIHGLHNAALYGLKVLEVETPKIVTIHSYTGIISSNKSKSINKITNINNYLKLADGIIHVSNADKSKGEEYGFCFNKYSETIYNGVEKGSSNSFANGQGICFVGYLIHKKRISLFLKSIQYLIPNIEQIKIAGDGPLRQGVEIAANSNPSISYLGVVPNEEIRKMMRKFSLLVVPSLSESFGLVYIEALFEGMAVIGYGPVIEEFHNVMELTEPEKKLMLPIHDKKMSPPQLAEMINNTYQFRRSREGIEAMKTLRQKAIHNFSWSTILNRVEDTYRKIIKEND